MWIVVGPVALVIVVVVGRRWLRAPEPETHGYESVADDTVDDTDLLEGGVQVSDLLEWLQAASERLSIDAAPTLTKVVSGDDTSICLRFTSAGVAMKLWVSGPSYMGPFLRLTLPESNPDDPGLVLEERSAVGVEKAIVALQKQPQATKT
jgi:hypothetical protein